MSQPSVDTISVVELEEMLDNRIPCTAGSRKVLKSCEHEAAWQVTKSCCRRPVHLCELHYRYAQYSENGFTCSRCNIRHYPARRIIASSRKI